MLYSQYCNLLLNINLHVNNNVNQLLRFYFCWNGFKKSYCKLAGSTMGLRVVKY